MATCPRCGAELARKPVGRPPIWCSKRCRTADSDARRARHRPPLVPVTVETLPPWDVEQMLAELAAMPS